MERAVLSHVGYVRANDKSHDRPGPAGQVSTTERHKYSLNHSKSRQGLRLVFPCTAFRPFLRVDCVREAVCFPSSLLQYLLSYLLHKLRNFPSGTFLGDVQRVSDSS